jgi:hypothetical protein
MNQSLKIAAFSIGAMIFLSASATFAQQPPVLPEQFAGWKGFPSAQPTITVPLPVQQELGAGRPEVIDYLNGRKRIHTVLQKYKDPSSAYAAYTLQLRPGMQSSDIRSLSAVASDRALMLIGNFVLDVEGAKSISTADLQTLGKGVEGHADHSPLPPIRAYLPEEGLVQGTQRYALGPAGFAAALASLNEFKYAPITPEIGFATGAEAVLSSYQVSPSKTLDLVIVEYPTPQLAEQRLRHIESLLAANPALAGTSVERKASQLSLVFAPASAQDAAKLRAAIKYQTEVTWNEPSQTLTDPPWVVVLKGIFVGTFAFCGIAIVLGIAFGGVRVLTKRLFPGKVFDRPEDIEVLQLGLSGKRIDPRDFY